jgi:hypothetical protein
LAKEMKNHMHHLEKEDKKQETEMQGKDEPGNQAERRGQFEFAA